MALTQSIGYSTAAFRRERESDWHAFEALVLRLEKGSISRLSDEELLATPRLYRATLSSLSLARATNLDAALVDYLEGLATRGYFLLYGVRESRFRRMVGFFVHGWPAAVRSLWKETLLMALLLALGAVTAWWLVASDPVWFERLIGPMAQGRTPGAGAEALRETIYGLKEDERTGLHIFATYLFTNNSQVSILAYALGFAFGVPTMMLIFSNGLPLGGLLWVFFDAGLGPDFVAWLAIHGTTELLAIFISGAAGLRVGLACAFPGARSRLAAASEAGKASGAAMIGVILMLLVAGLIEGFGRQLIQSMEWRFAVGGGFLVFWLGYFYVPRRARTT